MSNALQALLTETVRLGGAPGIAVGVSQEGRRSFSTAGVRTVTDSTSLSAGSRVRPGCIAKMMTAIVALELVADGTLDLNAPIEQYLPELRGTFVGGHVCAAHLLTHSSGYRGPNVADPSVRYYFGWEKLIQLLFDGYQLFAPGSQFNYEHTESVLLGEIVGRITGADIIDLHHSKLLSPLGIITSQTVAEDSADFIGEHVLDQRSRSFQPIRSGPPVHFWRASLQDSTLSVMDLLQVAEACAGVDSDQVLHAKTVSMLQKNMLPLPPGIGGKNREDIPLAFAYGCGQYGKDTYGHNGSARGQTCALRYNIRSGVVAVVALNCWRPAARDLICRKVMSEVSPTTAAFVATGPNGWNPKRLAGLYYGACGIEADVAVVDGQLQLTVRSGTGPPAMTATISCVDGRLTLVSSMPSLTVGFSGKQESATPFMMLGLNSFRKVR
jgi:CubicO group peptidase (beta-lactamase class C family)